MHYLELIVSFFLNVIMGMEPEEEQEEKPNNCPTIVDNEFGNQDNW